MKKLLFVILITLLISACAAPEEPIQDPILIAQATFDSMSTATALAIPPTATPIPVKPDIKICLAEEPNTLSNYQSPNAFAVQVIEALSPSMVQQVNYEYVSNSLQQIPTIENEGISLETIQVQKGDWIVDRFGNPVQLTNGVQAYPSGCQSNSCLVTYEEGSIEMDQASIKFVLNDNLSWNDGIPLTAQDSVFAYQINQELEKNLGNPMLKFTENYTAISDIEIEWKGLPGYLSEDAKTVIWQPLPQHMYTEQPTDEFLTSAQSLSWGPYQLESWESGQSIKMTANPFSPNLLNIYPNIEFKFVGNDSQKNINLLSNNDCSILMNDTFSVQDLTTDNFNNPDYSVIPSGPNGWLHLDLALQHQSHDDEYNLYHDRPAFLLDTLTRQGIAQCINRENLSTLFLQSAEMPSYISSSNPDHIDNLIAFDPSSGNEKLTEAGWLVGDDGLRYSQTNYILFDTKLSLDLFTDETFFQAAQLIKNDLFACGIEVNIQSLPSSELFAADQEAPIFGRNFDMALFSWASSQNDTCWLYQSEAVPGEDKSIYPYYWLGWNVSGWKNQQFDDACLQSRINLLGDNTEKSQEAQSIFITELPVIPLIEFQTFTATRNEICGYSPEAIGKDIIDFSKLGLSEYCE